MLVGPAAGRRGSARVRSGRGYRRDWVAAARSSTRPSSRILEGRERAAPVTDAMTYREFAPPPALASHVACLWSRTAAPARVVPDGCVDLVWTAPS